MHTFEKLLLAFTLSLITIQAKSFAFIADNLQYDFTSEETVSVTGIANPTGDIVIPDKVKYLNNSYIVNAIGDRAFYEKDHITSVLMPNTIITIGKEAFDHCRGLSSIIIPNSVISIGEDAFFGCDGLKEVILGESVETIGDNAFTHCDNIMSITIPDSTIYIGEHAFDYCDNATNLVIGRKVETIGVGAFGNMQNLKSIEYNAINCKYCNGLYGSSSKTHILFLTIGEDVQTIPDNFCQYSCYEIYNLVFPDKVTSIGKDVFYVDGHEGTKIHSLTFGKNLKSIGENSLYGAPEKIIWLGDSLPEGINRSLSRWFGSLTVHYVTNNKFNITNQKIYPRLNEKFSTGGVTYVPFGKDSCDVIDCIASESYKEIVIPKIISFKKEILNVGKINRLSFYENNYIEKLTSENEGDIDYKAFFKCNGLKEVELYNNGNLGNDVFYGCYNLNKATLNNRGFIGPMAFMGCNSLSTVNLCDGLTMIKAQAFYECSSITGINIPNSVTAMERSAFYNCSSMKNVTLGHGLTTLEDRTFSGCSSLETLYLPDNIKALGPSVFTGCSSLSKVTFSNCLETIGGWAFSHCSSLQSLLIPNSITEIQQGAFADCSSLENIIIGTGLRELLPRIFQNCVSIENIDIPGNINSIGGMAFNGCTSLKKITFLKSKNNQKLNLGNSRVNGEIKVLFNDCPLEYVYICRPISYSKIGNSSPFYGNTTLKTVEFTDEETTIYNREFSDCSSLETVKIGNGVSAIQPNAFANCTTLKYFSIGNAIKNIGEDTFSKCNALIEFRCDATVPPICAAGALNDIDKTECVLFVPNNSIDKYKSSEQWKEFYNIKDESAGIDLIQDNKYMVISMTDGIIVQNAIGKIVEVYTFDGKSIKYYPHYQNEIIRLKNGIYLIRINNEILKMKF